jgi:hydroxymethylpyrimidine pyrophosphatase-like HAD family hydrolase
VQRRGRGKAEACRWLSESRGIPPARVVAVGDQCNDVPLLREAGLAVAMGNAVPAARAEADLVIGDHREEGVARFLDDHVA